MEDFNLILKELIKREEFNSNITDSLKQEFEKTAESYVQKGNLLDATKVFAITKNKEKLIQVAELCLKENKPYDAYSGFYYADDAEGLNKLGYIFLNLPDLNAALKCFKKSNNSEMILFIESNFS